MHMIVLLCMSTYIAASSSLPDSHNYGIILDGGSTGTKLKVYKWNRHQGNVEVVGQGETPRTLKYNLTMVAVWKFPPGIATKAYALHEMASYLEPIMQTARRAVPADKHSQTPIYFMATAGLRILPANVTNKLLNSIETNLQNRSLNPFVISDSNAVRVISGEEEAVYAWVSANYLNGFFWSNRPPTQSVGVLEMGGGSTQIAFLPDHSVYANMFPVQLAGVTYQLYAHSYLFYGQNYIVDRINDYLLALSITQNPCMLTGDNATRTAFGKSVHIHGSANVTKCLEIIDIFLKTADDNWCYPKPCAIGRTYQPPVRDVIFYAIAAFLYAPTYLNAVDSLGRLDILLLKHNAELYCQKSLQEVVKEGLPAAYASPYCTMGLYIPSLLVDAYGFSPDKNIVYVKPQMGDVEIDWALGAMLLMVEESASGSEDTECDPVSGRASTHIHSYATQHLTHILVLLIFMFHWIL